jgi:uncharacterized membrane protein YfcA
VILSLVCLFVALGLATGLAAGMFGIGGGILLVPILTLLLSSYGLGGEHVVHVAIATSLATILFTSISSVYAHHLRGAVRWPVAALLTPGLLLGAWLGPRIASSLSTTALSALFGLFACASALHIRYGPRPHASRELPGWPGMSLFGVTLGTASGVIGGGGGFLAIPFMAACNVPLHNAVATSAALGVPIALAGTLSNIYHGWQVPGLPEHSLGYVYLPALVAVGVASVVAAPLGARIAHRMNVSDLRRMFALLLLTLGGYMFWRAWHP